MNNKIDIAELKRNTDIVAVIGRFVTLKQDGPHWKASCPFHKDNTASFTVTPSKRMFKCFGCGAGGDVIDFLELNGRTKAEAIREISDPNNTDAIPIGGSSQRESFKKESVEPVWKQVIPAIKFDVIPNHPKHGKPSIYWPYLNEIGLLIGYAVRFDLPDGGKEVMPLIYANKNGVTKWVYKGFEKPRPLYGLHKLLANPDAPVLLVEGEKTADAAQLLFPNTVVLSWMGGVAGVKHADFSVLKGRLVIMWPDNDEPGYTAMHNIYDIIKDVAENVKWVINPSGEEKGWDLADSEWTADEAQKYSSTNIIDYPGRSFEYEQKTAVNSLTWTIGNQMESKPTEVAKQLNAKVKANKKGENSTVAPPPPVMDFDHLTVIGSEYFRILGAQKEGNGMLYYFYAFNTKTVIGLSPSGMTKNNMMQLAPLNWWKNTFPDQKNAFQVDQAANYLINISSQMGTFSEKWLRGRGAWMDGKRVVIHAGDKLFINGIQTALSDYKSKYIYEIGEELGFTVTNPLPTAESAKFTDLLKLLHWDRPINSYLLAGWCVVAPICGALNWRPHIWLTGAAGTGKSWVFKKIIRELLGETGLAVQGETSEAGLRQTLGHDALPVVFDEAEGEDRRAQDRMQAVLSLMRASSANDGGVMAKGSAGGSAKTYRIRSCFAFASIGVQVAQQSDRTRVTVLGLLKDKAENAGQKWLDFQAKYAALITDEYCNSMRARTISILPTILANIKTFSNAAAAVIGEQRAGDQVGVLLAGAYSLTSTKAITYEEAVKWVADKDWDEEKGMGATRDEVALMSYLLEQPVRIETGHATVERSIGELVLIALYLRLSEYNINPAQANDRLKRSGIKVKDEFIYISNSDVNIQKMLVGTAWSKNHNKILMRIDGAVGETSERFASGVSTRAVRIHKDVLFKGLLPEVIVAPVSPMEAASELLKPSEDIFKQEDLDF